MFGEPNDVRISERPFDQDVTARGKRLLPTSRIFGGSMALFIWGNTLLLLHAQAAGQSIKVINVIYWACALYPRS